MIPYQASQPGKIELVTSDPRWPHKMLGARRLVVPHRYSSAARRCLRWQTWTISRSPPAPRKLRIIDEKTDRLVIDKIYQDSHLRLRQVWAGGGERVGVSWAKILMSSWWAQGSKIRRGSFCGCPHLATERVQASAQVW